MIDPVLDTLFLPIEQNRVTFPATGRALFLSARMGAGLSGIARETIVFEQGFKPEYDALIKAGFSARSEGDTAQYALSLILPARQREQSRSLLARAVKATLDNGVVISCVSNLEGAKSVEADLKRLCGNISNLSKHKCRVFWATIRADKIDHDLLQTWVKQGEARPIADGQYLSRPGLFAWDRIDAGSKLLAENLPDGLKGVGADLGAGFGYLTKVALEAYPDITRLDAYEAQAEALELARLNLKGQGVRARFLWQDVTQGIEGGYDFIISNPPFHLSRADRHDLGKGFIMSAAKGLRCGGQFWMVANRHLPYEDTLKSVFKTVVMIKDNGAFKIFKAVKA